MSQCGSLEYILLGVQWAACMFLIMFFIKLGKVSAIISSNILSAQSFLSPLPSFFFSALLSGTPQSIYWSVWCCITSPLDSVHFSPSIFFSIPRLNNFHGPLFKFIGWILMPVKISLWNPHMNFSFQLLYFSAPGFLLGFLPFIDISILFMYHLLDFLYLFSFEHL